MRQSVGNGCIPLCHHTVDHDGGGLVNPLVIQVPVGPQQEPQHRRAADDLDQPVRIDAAVHLAALDGMRPTGPAPTWNSPVKRLITRALRSASAAMSAIRPGSAARTTGLVNTSLAAAIIAWMSAAMLPSGVSSAVGAAGNAASWTSSALLDHRRYSAVLVVPARSATAAMVRFE